MGSVTVGLEPVAVALQSETEVWVVNHLSDSVSVVDLSGPHPRVVRTLLVGDEPRDIVFAGRERRRAFVTTAHRGQHRAHPSLAGVPGAGEPQLGTAGIGRADIWVFDAEEPGSGGPGGRPLAIVSLFGDKPGPLGVSPDGGTVYAGILHSGNQTTVVPAEAVCDGFEPSDLEDACPQEFPGAPGGNPGPATNYQGAPAPETGLIVRYDRSSDEWRDELGRSWNAAVRFDLPDLDLFALDAATLEPIAAHRHVGTTLLGIAVHPATGRLYVANTDAQNEVRFEGEGRFGGSTVQGHLAEARITIIDGEQVLPRRLNRHIDYNERPAPAATAEHSLALPLGLAISSDGSTLYVAAFGSSRIGVLETAALDNDSFDPRQASRRYLEVAGGGPSGLVLDEARRRLYVLTRFDNTVRSLDLVTGAELERRPLHNPEPPEVIDGRPLLYDARRSSSNGEAACASCHLLGDVDHLAWDLGDPDGEVTQSPIPTVFGEIAESLRPGLNGTGNVEDFHPMKGPMVTQTLRGLRHSGAMHWRGDRATGRHGTAPFDAEVSLLNFSVAFRALLGRAEDLPREEMAKLARFLLHLTLPPNPVRALDNSLNADEKLGRDFFLGPRRAEGQPEPSPFGKTCNDCHELEPALGRFGTSTEQSLGTQQQIFKIPHLRNLYDKVGMFGKAHLERFSPGDNEHMGDQVRGFGYLHDGSIDSLTRFMRARVFDLDHGGEVGFRDDGERFGVVRFLLAFASDLAPIVGQQATLSRKNAAALEPRLDLLRRRAGVPFVSRSLGGSTRECDLVVKGIVDGEPRGFWYRVELDRFESDRRGEPLRTAAGLGRLARAAGQELTYTCVPPGSGRRVGLDRDLDGYFDADERDAGTDPADADSVPDGCRSGLEHLCLLQNRFEITLEWQDFGGNRGRGTGVVTDGARGGSDVSGLLWFFEPDNWEMLIKVLDGCSQNGHFWVLAAATTNVGYTLEVRDTIGGTTRRYTNTLGTAADAIIDTSAFSGCSLPIP